jgi:hypothetical protein
MRATERAAQADKQHRHATNRHCDHRPPRCAARLKATNDILNKNVARTRCRCETSPGADVARVGRARPIPGADAAGKFQSQCRMARGAEPSLSDVERREWPRGGRGGMDDFAAVKIALAQVCRGIF